MKKNKKPLDSVEKEINRILSERRMEKITKCCIVLQTFISFLTLSLLSVLAIYLL